VRTIERTPSPLRSGADCFRSDGCARRITLAHVPWTAIVALLLAVTPAPAMPPPALDLYQRVEDMHHTAWTAKDGLTGEPYDLAQTTDGYLWIGTTNGLFRFDGIAFERYQPAAGALQAVGVSTLRAGRAGGLWVGYIRGGVTFIAPDGRITNYSLDTGLPVGVIRDIAQDQDGVVWVAATGGLARFESGRWLTVRMDWKYPCRSAWRLLVANDGTLWVGGASPNRLLFLPKGTRTFYATDLTAETHALVETGNRTVAVADGRMVYEVRREPEGSVSWRTFRQLPCNDMAMDRDGGLWFAGTGVTRLRVDRSSTADTGDPVPPLEEQFTADMGLSGRIGTNVFVDREHNVWVATETGLDRFRRRNLAWKPDPRLEQGGALVVDTNGDAWSVSWVSPSLARARDGEAVTNAPDALLAAYPDPDGSIWIARNEQFLQWIDGRFVPVPPPDEVVKRGYLFNVMAAAKDRSGRLWASVNGVGQFYRKDQQWTFVPVLPDRPDWTASRVHVDANDRVWLAYRDEVAMVEQGKVHLFTKADGLDVGPVFAIGSRDGEVWIGGEWGLAFLHANRFHVVQTLSGRDTGTVLDIVTTGDGLWLSTAIGIVHVPEAEYRRVLGDPLHRVQSEVFDLVSDLPEALRANVNSRAFTAVEDGRGILWFLTNAGLVRLDPQRIVRNTMPPPVSIRAVSADDNAYAPRGDVSLPPLTRTLRIDYAALSLTIPERVRFRYRLEGWETDWHDAGTRRTVFYTDLTPGRYAFRVLACNNDGVWNETGATLAFLVAPAWYQTKWFQAFVVVCAIASIALLYRMRVRRVSAVLAARFDERLAERTRLARELHDTLLQTVHGSKMVADDALEGAGDPERLRRALERLSEWLERAVTEGRAALHSLRGSAVEVNDLAESFRRAADDPMKPPILTVSVVVRGAVRDLHPIVRDEIYRIGYEAMRNAYTHSRATRLDIEIIYAHDLTLRISDNGVGIDPAIADSGKRGRFGLPGMRERAANIGGALSIDSSSAGTRITLGVPGRSVFQRGASEPAATRSL
jgi:signal transduction histidine kinase/ligand-binding sensor domain-containing protein